MNGSRARLNLVVWRGVKHSLPSNININLRSNKSYETVLAVNGVTDHDIPNASFALDTRSRLVIFHPSCLAALSYYM